MSVGIITIATGSRRYIDQAVAMARSVRVHNPGLPVSVVTDWEAGALPRGVFERVVPFRPEWGNPFLQKLHLERYTPYEETLFVDSDCLVLAGLGEALERLGAGGRGFGCQSDLVAEGKWYLDVGEWAKRLGVGAIPMISSGVLYWRRGEASERVFGLARWYYGRYGEFGIPQTHSSMPDEPAISMAMLELGVAGVPREEYLLQLVPFPDMCDRYDLDVLGGKAVFEFGGRSYWAPIMHFGGWTSRQWVYRRESEALRLWAERGWSARWSRRAAVGRLLAESAAEWPRRVVRGVRKRMGVAAGVL